MRAGLRGAIYAESHIAEAIDIVLTFAEGADPDHQRFLLETDLRNAQRPDGLGRGTLEQWEALRDVLLEFDVLESPVDVRTAFDGSFVDQLYDSGDLD